MPQQAPSADPSANPPISPEPCPVPKMPEDEPSHRRVPDPVLDRPLDRDRRPPRMEDQLQMVFGRGGMIGWERRNLGDERGPPKEGSERWRREEEYKRARVVEWERRCRGEGGRAHSRERGEPGRREEGHVLRHGERVRGLQFGGKKERVRPREAKREVGGLVAVRARLPLQPAVKQDHQPTTLEESLRMLQDLRQQLEKYKEMSDGTVRALDEAKRNLGKMETLLNQALSGCRDATEKATEKMILWT